MEFIKNCFIFFFMVIGAIMLIGMCTALTYGFVRLLMDLAYNLKGVI